MSFADDLAHLGMQHCARLKPGAWYASAAHLSLGAGLIYPEIDYIVHDIGTDEYVVQSGPVLVLTHECDVDQANVRAFNDLVLVCPIIKLEDYAAVKLAQGQTEAARAIVRDAASDIVSRLLYLPRHLGPYVVEELRYGGFLYLNSITNIHVSLFDPGKCQPSCALSSYALQWVDAKLQNHLFRPKAEFLARLT